MFINFFSCKKIKNVKYYYKFNLVKNRYNNQFLK